MRRRNFRAVPGEQFFQVLDGEREESDIFIKISVSRLRPRVYPEGQTHRLFKLCGPGSGVNELLIVPFHYDSFLFHESAPVQLCALALQHRLAPVVVLCNETGMRLASFKYDLKKNAEELGFQKEKAKKVA